MTVAPSAVVGSISGVASAIKQRAAIDGRTVRVIGVQAANASPYPVSLEKGAPTQITILPTIADGIAVSKPGELNFEISGSSTRSSPSARTTWRRRLFACCWNVRSS